MSLFTGKVGTTAILHATASEYTDAADLQAGVLPDTLFHSSLPLFSTDKEYVINRSSSQAMLTGSYESFVFPADLLTDLALDHMFLVVGTLESGELVFSTTDIWFGAVYNCADFSYANEWNAQVSAWVENSGLMFSSNPALILTDRPHWNFIQPTTPGDPYDITTNLQVGGLPYLTKRAAAAYYIHANSTFGIDPGPMASLTFYRMNLKAPENGEYAYTPLAGDPASVEISNTALKINDTDLLAGKKYLVYNDQGVQGTTITSRYSGTQIPGSLQGIALRNENLPNFCTPSTFKHDFLSGHYIAPRIAQGHFPGLSGSSTAVIPCALNHSNALEPTPPNFGAAQQQTIDMSANFVVPVYEFTTAPTITSVEFSADTLELNGNYTVYSPTVQPISQFSSRGLLSTTQRTVTFDQAAASTYENLEDSLDMGTLGTTAHIIFSVRDMPDGSYTQDFTGRTMAACNLGYANSSGGDPELSIRLAALQDGQTLYVGGLGYRAAYYTSLSTGESRYTTLTFLLKRNGNAIELWSVGSSTGVVTGTYTFTIPQLNLNVARLYGGS